MRKILFLISLMTVTSCTTIEYVPTKSKVFIPEHQKLDALTVEEVKRLDPAVKIKFENIKAALIANIKQLEHNIRVHNEDTEIPVPDT